MRKERERLSHGLKRGERTQGIAGFGWNERKGREIEIVLQTKGNGKEDKRGRLKDRKE